MYKLSEKTIMNAVNTFGTPLYLYNGDAIRNTYRELRKIIPAVMDVFYSMKANPVLGICQLLCAENASCEVCSLAELHVALQAGFKPENIIFVGPGKTESEISACIHNKIYAIVCESTEELKQINHIAQSNQYQCPILLRINPDFSINNAPLKMGGKPTQFGVDLKQISNNESLFLQYKNIHLRGIHVYNGTRILDANAIVANTVHILKLAEVLANLWQCNFDCIDIGGGFGIPYFEGESKLDVEKIFIDLEQTFTAYLTKHPHTRFILECGRYLVGEAGCLIGKVLAAKISHEETFAITDVGMHCHMAATGIGSFVRRNFPVSAITTNRSNPELHSYNVTGPLCTPGDTLAKQVKLPSLQVNDLVIIEKSGAYGATASPGRFLSHGFPAEALYDKTQLYLLRRSENLDDILSTQISLDHLNKTLSGE